MSRHDPRWDITAARGKEAEQLVRRFRSAIALGALEVKRDDEAETYRNFFYETECLRMGVWRPSGIRDPESQAVNWVHVSCGLRLILWQPRWVVRLMAEEFGTPKEMPRGTHPTRGLVVPVNDVLRHSFHILTRDPSMEKAA